MQDDENYDPDVTGQGTNIGDTTRIITDLKIVEIWKKFIKNKEN